MRALGGQLLLRSKFSCGEEEMQKEVDRMEKEYGRQFQWQEEEEGDDHIDVQERSGGARQLREVIKGNEERLEHEEENVKDKRGNETRQIMRYEALNPGPKKKQDDLQQEKVRKGEKQPHIIQLNEEENERRTDHHQAEFEPGVNTDMAGQDVKETKEDESRKEEKKKGEEEEKTTQGNSMVEDGEECGKEEEEAAKKKEEHSKQEERPAFNESTGWK